MSITNCNSIWILKRIIFFVAVLHFIFFISFAFHKQDEDLFSCAVSFLSFRLQIHFLALYLSNCGFQRLILSSARLIMAFLSFFFLLLLLLLLAVYNFLCFCMFVELEEFKTDLHLAFGVHIHDEVKFVFLFFRIQLFFFLEIFSFFLSKWRRNEVTNIFIMVLLVECIKNCIFTIQCEKKLKKTHSLNFNKYK